MSVLDNVPGAESKQDYHFLTGDLSFIDEMDQEKQRMEIDERPDFDIPEEEHPPIMEDEEDPERVNVAIEETAALVTDAIDSGAALGLSLLSKGDAEKYKATEEQKGRIRRVMFVYCQQVGGYIPLWLQLVILIVGIYGSKIPGALAERKINILEAKVAEQEKRLKAYETEKRAEELRREIDRRKHADKVNNSHIREE